jgi:polysaccharide biosynthesis/export protein
VFPTFFYRYKAVMIRFSILFVMSAVAVFPAVAQPQAEQSAGAQSPGTQSIGAQTGGQEGAAANLPSMPVGVDDLIYVSVYDSPELTRNVRIGADGTIRLPLLKQKIKVDGMLPAEIETAIADELQKEGILVEPVVSVAVAEYRSRPISVVGAVKAPITFQALSNTTLLDAITRAQGITEFAGKDIIITRHAPDQSGKDTVVSQRVPVKSLLDEGSEAANVRLFGGEEIRVPEAGRIFVVGNVRKPGAVDTREANGTTVLKAIAMSEGLAPYTNKYAYIYRKEAGPQGKEGIPVELSKIMDRKMPDVALEPNDILFIPDSRGKKVSIETLERVLAFGTAASTTLIYGAVIR